MPHLPDQTDHTMSFGDHLEELRRRVLLCLLVPIPVAVVTFFLSETLINWLALPLYDALAAHGLRTRVQSLSPPEVLVAQIKLSFIAAIIISGPWILWQAWQFIRPGLHHHERRFVHLLIPGSVVLTISGVALMYFAMLPLMLRVLIGFGTDLEIRVDAPPVDPRVEHVLSAGVELPVLYERPSPLSPGDAWLAWPDLELFVAVPDPEGGVEVIEVEPPMSGAVAQEFRISTYLSFVLILMLGIVIAFQMPLVILLLGWLGLASPAWLRRHRRYAALVCGIVSAVITPADVISMVMMLAPLYGLYELGIVLLVIAPVSAVAEGRVFDWKRVAGSRGTDKGDSKTSQPVEPAQPTSTIPRRQSADESQSEPVDGEKDR
jgi:Tat protein translocase TatC